MPELFNEAKNKNTHMTDPKLSHFRERLQRRITKRNLPFADLAVDEDEIGGDWRVIIRARCTDDPLFRPPPSVGVNADGSIPTGPWNHRQVLVTVVFSESEETGRRVLLTTVNYRVDRDHANYYPLPEGCGDTVAVTFNWEFDRETLAPGRAEMRDGMRLHYCSVLPPKHAVSFVEACAAEAEDWV